MDTYSILTVDLNQEVSGDKRNKFYEFLAGKDWTKINELTTLWYARWKAAPTEQEIVDATKRDIEGAAAHSKVSHYDVALAICGKPVVWTK